MTHDLFAAVAPAFGRLLEEPSEDWRVSAARACRVLVDAAPAAADLVRRFEQAASDRSLDALRECYASTFELSPVCVPYVSVHLFGDESFKRAGLMGGFADAYRRAGFDPGSELPDHVATILTFVPCMSLDEQRDLVECVLRPAVDRMAQALFGSRNPYRHLLDALRGVLASLAQPETVHA